MKTIKTQREKIQSGEYDQTFRKLYGKNEVEKEQNRYLEAIQQFEENFNVSDEAEISFFSAPGRTEVGGNHTDHQHGCVLAASVNLDAITVAAKTSSEKIEIKSQGYPLCVVELADLSVQDEEKNSTLSLIRGVAAGFKERGYVVGPFSAYITSEVFEGSGLSSSAAFEVLVGVVLNNLYNNGEISDIEIAQISQYAENVYFGKPSGLMDQMASSVGGFVSIDFKDPADPIIKKVDFDLESAGYALAIVDTRSSHDDLTEAYSDITKEMGAIANELGETVLRDTDPAEFEQRLTELREKFGDRAVLRAMHFYRENEIALEEANALNNGDIETFLNLVNVSGRSSFYALQNAYVSDAPQNQSMTIALYTAGNILADQGASRIHGGGFAGTIQAFVPMDLKQEFSSKMDTLFGENACHFLNIREYGGVEVTPELGQ